MLWLLPKIKTFCAINRVKNKIIGYQPQLSIKTAISGDNYFNSLNCFSNLFNLIRAIFHVSSSSSFELPRIIFISQLFMMNLQTHLLPLLSIFTFSQFVLGARMCQQNPPNNRVLNDCIIELIQINFNLSRRILESVVLLLQFF